MWKYPKAVNRSIINTVWHLSVFPSSLHLPIHLLPHFKGHSKTFKSESEVAQLCPTLSNPPGVCRDCSPPGSSIHGIFQATVLEWGAIAFSIKIFKSPQNIMAMCKKLGKERDTCTPMFITALFTIARTWKQPRCPSADKWIRKLCYIYTME